MARRRRRGLPGTLPPPRPVARSSAAALSLASASTRAFASASATAVASAAVTSAAAAAATEPAAPVCAVSFGLSCSARRLNERGLGEPERALLALTTAATPAAAAAPRSTRAGRGGTFWCRGLALPRHTANSEHTSGAMEPYMRGFDWRETHVADGVARGGSPFCLRAEVARTASSTSTSPFPAPPPPLPPPSPAAPASGDAARRGLPRLSWAAASLERSGDARGTRGESGRLAPEASR